MKLSKRLIKDVKINEVVKPLEDRVVVLKIVLFKSVEMQFADDEVTQSYQTAMAIKQKTFLPQEVGEEQ